MKATYIFRIDDVCPEMDWKVFQRLQKLFNRYHIKPILGVIPDNHDDHLKIDPPHPRFWPEIKKLSQAGWIVAQHGYQHQYVTRNSGLIGMNNRSEFAGLPYQEQLAKLKAGQEILEQKLGLSSKWFMAPAHSFDQNTCKALQWLGFKYITDGVYLTPIQRFGLLWLPQQLWKPTYKLFGVWTICIHPNTTGEEYLVELAAFLKRYHQNCTTPPLVEGHSVFNPLYSFLWYCGLKFYRMVKRS